MGADLFQSYLFAIFAACTLAFDSPVRMALPVWLAGAGLFSSVIGFLFVAWRRRCGCAVFMTCGGEVFPPSIYVLRYLVANTVFGILALFAILLLFGRRLLLAAVACCDVGVA